MHWPCLLQDVLNERLLFKQTGSSSTKTITHHFFVLGGAKERKLSMQPKFGSGAENVVKQSQQTFVNGLLGFYYFRHLYSAGSACVLLTIIAWVPIDMGNSICTAH